MNENEIEHNINHPRYDEVETIVLRLARDDMRLRYAANWYILGDVMIYAYKDHHDIPEIEVSSVDEFIEDYRYKIEDFDEEYGPSAAREALEDHRYYQANWQAIANGTMPRDRVK